MKSLSFENKSGTFGVRRVAILLAVSTAIVVVILIIMLVSPLRVNRDASLHLLIGQLLLRGAVPYVDYVEINPPLIHYLHVIPVAIAQWIGINPIPVFLLLVLALSLWSIATVIYLLHKNIPHQGILIGAVVALSMTVLDLKLFTTNEFGEREHIFFLLVMPYVILRWLRWRGHLPDGNRLGIVVGLAAGIGSYIKPHFLIIVLALELFWSVSERRRIFGRGPEVMTVIVIGIAYAAFLLLMPSGMRTGLLSVVKSVLAGGYRAYGDQGPFSLILDQTFLLLIGFLPFLFIRSRNNRDDAESLLLSMSVIVLSTLVVYGLQARGFAYHLISAMGAEYFILFTAIFILAPRFKSVVLVSDASETGRTTRWLQIAWYLIIGCVLITAVKQIGDLSPGAIRNAATLADADVIAAIRDNSDKDDGVLVVSTMAEPFRLVLQAGRRLASKYIPTNPISFGISGITDVAELYDPAYKLPSSVQGYLSELEDSIAEDRPALIIIDSRKSCVGCPVRFQVSEFLRARGVYDRAITGSYTAILEAERFVILKSQVQAPQPGG